LIRLPLNSKPVLIIFLCVFFILLFGAPFSQGRFYVHGQDLTPRNAELLLERLAQVEKEFSEFFTYVPAESFDIIVLSSVKEMQSAFNLGPWVGAYYEDYKSYLQPIEVLIKREVLERIIFIEYAHYFFTSYTNNACPAWFNEACSYYLYMLWAGTPLPTGTAAPLLPVQAGNYKFKNFSDFSDLKANIRDYERLQAFYHYALNFCYFLKTQKQVTIFSDLLKMMHQGKSFAESVQLTTGKTMEALFEKEFLKWRGEE
jgi:hypothetical protein